MIANKRIQPGRSSRRRGATAVEFALVAPIIFLLFLGSIEMTNLNMIRHTAMNAAYEGARQTIVAGGTADDARKESLRLLNAVHIGNGAVVGAKAAVTGNVPDGQRFLGIPAAPEREMKRIFATLHRLPEMRKDVQRIKTHLKLPDLP